ncbi:Putative O-antigen transporter [[Pasteurella] aerogenes]|nr:Putative O-antigen transporter [[Pasteurella] aerogenes]
MNFILTMSNFLFPLITFPYISRVLFASGIGTVSFATSIIAYFSMIGMMGIPTYGIRACAKVRDDENKLRKVVYEILLLNLCFMFFSLIVLSIAIFSVEKLYQEKELYFILASTLVFNVLGVEWLYKALEKYSYITIRSLIFKLCSLILLFVFVKSSDDYLIYAAITVFATVGAGILNFLNLRNVLKLRIEPNLDLLKHIKPSFSFFLLTVSITIYANLDTIMLGLYQGDETVGYYTAAVKVKQILISVVTSLGAVLLPRLAFYYEHNRMDEFNDLIKKSLGFVLVISIPLVVYFTLNAQDTIIFLSGDTFILSILPLQLIMPSLLFIALSNLMGWQILVPMNKDKLLVISTLLGAVVGLSLNLVFIPRLGASGAAISSSVAEFSVVTIQFFFLRKIFFDILKSISPSIGKILISVILSASTIFIVNKFGVFSPFLNLLITGSVFFISYFLFLLIMKEYFTFQIMNTAISKIIK